MLIDGRPGTAFTSSLTPGFLDEAGRPITGDVQLVPERPSQNQSRAEFLLPQANQAAGALDQFEEVGMADAVFERFGANFAQSPDFQVMMNNAIILTEAHNRMTSGAALNETEVLQAARLLVPQFGDSPELRAQKARRRALLVEAIQVAAAGGRVRWELQTVDGVKVPSPIIGSGSESGSPGAAEAAPPQENPLLDALRQQQGGG